MSPEEVLKAYGSQYKFHKQTGMSHATLGNWLKWGFVPRDSQYKLQKLTNGILKVDRNINNDL